MRFLFANPGLRQLTTDAEKKNVQRGKGRKRQADGRAEKALNLKIRRKGSNLSYLPAVGT